MQLMGSAQWHSGRIIRDERLVPVLASYSCDMMEGYALKGQLGPNCKMRSYNTLAPVGHLADFEHPGKWPRRTQQAAVEVSASLSH